MGFGIREMKNWLSDFQSVVPGTIIKVLHLSFVIGGGQLVTPPCINILRRSGHRVKESTHNHANRVPSIGIYQCLLLLL